jgi:hypothetical protein
MGTAHNLSSMDIFYTVATKQATYHFVANPQINLVRITKLIRKQQKGYDQSTTMSIETARKFARQLQAKWVIAPVPGAMPGFGYYHPPRVVTLIIMAIRKSIAAQFFKAARALEKDQSKEQAGRLINGIRISLANVIMPNIPLSK